MKSIFQAGGALPVIHPTYVERRADQDALRIVLNGEYLRVIAPRQMGKTSLLKRLAHRLGERGWRCAYVDLSLLMGFQKAAWYEEFGKILGKNLSLGRIPNLSNQIDLRRYLLDIVLPYANGYPYVALCLDEVEGAGKAHDTDGQPFSDTFFMALRNLYNERDDHEGTLVIALAGAVDPDALVTDPDISPFNVGQGVSLDDFTLPETRSLTNHLSELGVRVDEAIHQAIYDWTGGHPYLTQRLCQILEQAIHRGELTTLTADVVTTMVEQALLKPASPLERDKNLKHVSKMLDRLSTPAAQLWFRLQVGETASRRDASEAIYLELYLTGAVKGQNEQLIIRNEIYQKTFADTLSQTNVDTRSTIMKETVRIFISSTWQDLQPEREAVEKALHRMQEAEFSGMEYFGSRPETPRDASLAEVDRSDIYVGLFAHRYGSGITEAEYRRAKDRKLPCLIYFKDDNVPVIPAHIERDPEKFAKLEALKQELKTRHIVSSFTTPDQLATQVITDLHNFLGRKKPTEKPAGSGAKYQINIGSAQGLAIGDGATVVQNFSEREFSKTQPAPAGSDQRCTDLTENIREALSLIKLYEEQRRLSSDPKEKRRTEKEIADLRQQLSEYEAEARQLGCS